MSAVKTTSSMTSKGQNSIEKLLIANRGEIARRIISTCKKLGIETIAIFSPADSAARYVEEADQAIALKSNKSDESYLDIEQIIALAQRVQADAIHPGYGFLSENKAFARACQKAKITFVGPNPEAIDAMGDKRRAKELMKQHDVPTIPGYEGDNQDPDFLAQQAKAIGLPVLVKASAGGGGKGMRIVNEASELNSAITSAQAEAKAAFGDDNLIIERYFAESRHIEVQIIADQHGNTFHLFERDCSTQRRFQKIIEEAPAPNISEALRQQLHQAAINAAKAVNYTNAGTVEFLVADNQCFFLEMNTRLQVEHPVTEAITGLDLVALQIAIAEGKELPFKQRDVKCQGHAIQARLYAEDPLNEFRPAAGDIHMYYVPQQEGIREDTALKSQDLVSPLYDPMIAKIIAYADNRQSATRLLKSSLRQSTLIGIPNNRHFVHTILGKQEFQNSSLHTRWIEINTEQWKPQLSPTPNFINQAAIIATVFLIENRAAKQKFLKQMPIGFRNNPSQHHKEEFTYNDEKYSIEYASNKRGEYTIYQDQVIKLSQIKIEGNSISFQQNSDKISALIIQNNDSIFVQYQLFDFEFKRVDRHPSGDTQAEATGDVRAPLPGRIESIAIKTGDAVNSGDLLLSINSMKMSNAIYAEIDGTIQDIFIAIDDQVEANTRLILIE